MRPKSVLNWDPLFSANCDTWGFYDPHTQREDLYRMPEIVTLGRFPGGGESDSRWRTKEVRHVGSDTLTPGF